MAATKPAKAATIQFLSILFLFVDFGLPLAGMCFSVLFASVRWRWQRQLLTAPGVLFGPPIVRFDHFLVGMNERDQKLSMSRITQLYKAHHDATPLG